MKTQGVKYEVRSERPDEDGPETQAIHIETTRTDRKAAEADVADLKMFGIKAWIVEIPS